MVTKEHWKEKINKSKALIKSWKYQIHLRQQSILELERTIKEEEKQIKYYENVIVTNSTKPNFIRHEVLVEIVNSSKGLYSIYSQDDLDKTIHAVNLRPSVNGIEIYIERWTGNTARFIISRKVPVDKFDKSPEKTIEKVMKEYFKQFK